MASLKNPAIAGDVQFDTFIYGAPPLAYPASLSQYVIYNTPDPAYVTGRINVSAFANLGSWHAMAISQHERTAQWTCLRAPRERPFPARGVCARES